MGAIDQRLQELTITLPEPVAPVANYVPFVVSGKLVFISGQIPLKDGKPEHVGIVGDTVTVEQAVAAARLCGINILAQLKAACSGDLDKVSRCVKLGGFVNTVAGFADQPKIINGCSDLMVEVFGEHGRHARFAVGAGSLPLNVAVEIDAVFELT